MTCLRVFSPRRKGNAFFRAHPNYYTFAVSTKGRPNGHAPANDF